jgi:hypothetical protein
VLTGQAVTLTQGGGLPGLEIISGTAEPYLQGYRARSLVESKQAAESVTKRATVS